MIRKNTKLKLMITTAVFAAVITSLTFFVKIPTFGGGYVHVGDFIIYLAAVVLPMPYAVAAAAIGGGLADLLGGYAHYIIPTMIVKALITLPFSSKSKKILTHRNALMVIPSGVITVVGYAITKAILLSIDKITAQGGFMGSILSPVTWGTAFSITTLENTAQAFASAIFFIITAFALDKINFKQKIRSSLL